MGQRKYLRPQQESNPWPPEHKTGALSTELRELMMTNLVVVLEFSWLSGKSVRHVYSGGHRFDSCRRRRCFLCPTLLSSWIIHLSHFITELKIHHLHSIIKSNAAKRKEAHWRVWICVFALRVDRRSTKELFSSLQHGVHKNILGLSSSLINNGSSCNKPNTLRRSNVKTRLRKAYDYRDVLQLIKPYHKTTWLKKECWFIQRGKAGQYKYILA